MKMQVKKVIWAVACSVLWLSKPSTGFLWFSDMSRRQSIDDCLYMKQHSPDLYAASSCQQLLDKHLLEIVSPVLTSSPRPLVTMGWGWSGWSEWVDDACPAECGRRCRVRYRSCAGPFHKACENRGQAFEYDNCPAASTTSSTSTSFPSSSSFSGSSSPFSPTTYPSPPSSAFPANSDSATEVPLLPLNPTDTERERHDDTGFPGNSNKAFASLSTSATSATSSRSSSWVDPAFAEASQTSTQRIRVVMKRRKKQNNTGDE